MEGRSLIELRPRLKERLEVGVGPRVWRKKIEFLRELRDFTRVAMFEHFCQFRRRDVRKLVYANTCESGSGFCFRARMDKNFARILRIRVRVIRRRMRIASAIATYDETDQKRGERGSQSHGPPCI